MINPQTIRVLLIEDNQEYASFIKARLADHHTREFTVDHVDTVGKALQKITAGGFDVILLDLHLPDGDGIDTFKRVRNQTHQIPIIVLTSVGDQAMATDALRHGALDYLIKGRHDREHFEQFVRFAIERHRKFTEVDKAFREGEPAAAAFQQVVTRNADGIIIVDRNGIVRFANPAVKPIFGRASDEFVGNLFGFPVVDGQTSELEVMRNGQKVVIEMRVAATEWNNETAYIASVRDITALKRTTQSLMVANARLKELQEIDRLKSTFVSNVSHELRTPLTVILSTVNNLLDGIMGKLTDDQSKWIRKVQAHAQRLHELVNDILDLSKLESGQIEIKPELVDVEELVAGLVANFQGMADQKQLKLAREISGRIPRIWGARGRLDQVVTNLITNAMKFTPAGGRITVSASAENDKVRIKVSDTGIGIPAEFREAIFERFKQVDGADSSPTRGIGLGLAICAEIINQHRGRIWVESEVGKGSQFIIQLPLDFRQQASLRPGKILIIDDDTAMCTLVSRVLEADGHQVHVIHTGSEALAYIGDANKMIDLIFLDLMMPEVDGTQILSRIQKDRPGIKTVIMTAYPHSDKGHRLVQDGIPMLSKPFDLKDVRAIVAKLLPASRSATS